MQPGKFVNRLHKYGWTLASLVFFVFLSVSAALFNVYSEPAQAAQAPSIITYQGKLLTGGLAASTTQSIIITLYNALSGGTAVYTASGTLGTPVALSVTPTSGIFSVNLGDTGTNSLDPAVFQNNQNLYLQLTIGGEVLSPRKPITAAPFAFNARYLDGVAATSTASSSTYIPISDTTGNFNFRRVTSTGIYANGALTVVGTSTFSTTTITTLSIGTSTFNLGQITIQASSTNATPLAIFLNNGLNMLSLASSTVSIMQDAGAYTPYDLSASVLQLGNASSAGIIKLKGYGALQLFDQNDSYSGELNSGLLLLSNGNGTNTSTYGVDTLQFYRTATNRDGVVRFHNNGSVSASGSLYIYGTGMFKAGTTTVVGVSTSTASIVSVKVQGKYAYAVDSSGANVLMIYNIADPTNPVVVGSVSSGEQATSSGGIFVAGKYVYQTNNSNNLQIIDVSNPNSPSIHTAYGGSSTGNDVYVSGRYAFLVREAGLDMLDVYNPDAITAVSTYATSTAKAVYVSGRYAYLMARATFHVFDTASGTLTQVGSLLTGFTNVDARKGLVVSGANAFVADNTGGLRIVHVGNPANPTLVATIAAATAVTHVEVSGKYLFFADGVHFKIYDVSVPSSPALITDLALPSGQIVNRFTVSGKYAYLATSVGLKIVDLQGIDTHAASIGNLSSGNLQVSDNAFVGNNLQVQSGLNVGIGGIMSNGSLAVELNTSSPGLTSALAAGTFTTYGSTTVLIADKRDSDGIIMSFRRNNSEQGTISVGGGTVSYNAFTGSHYAVLPAGTMSMQLGTLMTLTGNNNRLHNSSDSEILYGVTSTVSANDSRVLGSYLSLQTPGNSNPANPHLIMAVGNGQMWVADNGSNIEPGDFLISSAIGGHAMKDLGEFDQSYVVARAAESVDWSAVTSTTEGTKHVLLSVFYESFVKDNRLAKTFTINNASTTVTLGTASTTFGLKISQSLDFTGAQSSINFTNNGIFTSNVSGQSGARSFVMNAANFSPVSDQSLLTLQAGGVAQFVVRANGDVLTNGVIRADGFMTGTSTLDLAEVYPIKDGCQADGTCPEAGDAVCLVDNQVSTIQKCTFPYSDKAIGIISTDPGFTLGGAGKANERKVALAGRVPLKVSTRNGVIHVGDKLTTSDIAGVAMKAVENGPTIGVALQDFYDDSGSVLAFVKMGWWAPLTVSAPTSVSSTLSAEAIITIVLDGLKKLGVTIAQGMIQVGQFIADKVTSGEVVTQKLCVDETCITQTQFKLLLERNNITAEANNLPTSTPQMPTTPDETPTSTIPTSTDIGIPPAETSSSTPSGDVTPSVEIPSSTPLATPPIESSPVTPPTEPTSSSTEIPPTTLPAETPPAAESTPPVIPPSDPTPPPAESSSAGT